MLLPFKVSETDIENKLLFHCSKYNLSFDKSPFFKHYFYHQLTLQCSCINNVLGAKNGFNSKMPIGKWKIRLPFVNRWTQSILTSTCQVLIKVKDILTALASENKYRINTIQGLSLVGGPKYWIPKFSKSVVSKWLHYYSFYYLKCFLDKLTN